MQVPPEQERRLLFTAVARYLTTIAGPAGTLLVLDDLQWAGADALDLLITLMRTVPLLRVVGAYRTSEVTMHDPLATMIADLAREVMLTQVELGPLATEEASALLRSVLGGRTGREEAVAFETFEEARKVAQERGTGPWLARALAVAEAFTWNCTNSQERKHLPRRQGR